MVKHNWKALTVVSILAMVLLVLLAASASADGKISAGEGIESIPPTIDGMFYASGEDSVYAVLAENPNGLGTLYYYPDGNTIRAAMVVSTSVNDNVFGDLSQTEDTAYVIEADWDGKANSHHADALIKSEKITYTLQCDGAGPWTWTQDYAYYDQVGGIWRSSYLGNDGGGTPPPGLGQEASSLVWNFTGSGWDLEATSHTPAVYATWQSPYVVSDTLTGTDWPTYDPNWDWEWPLVYEIEIDLAASGCASNEFTLQVIGAHNSPPKKGMPTDVPVDPVYQDFGDAPYQPTVYLTDTYPTMLAQDPARHYIFNGGPWLGDQVDAEINGQQDGTALGDDGKLPNYPDNNDDEDGISPFIFPPSGDICFDVTMGVTSTGYVDGWIDFDRNGIWDADEYLDLGGRSFTPGEIRNVCVTPTDDAKATLTYARFRVSSSTTPLQPFGLAADGEVEDYQLNLNPLLIELASFGAKPLGGDILVEWETATELDNLGFNLYRSEAVDGPRVQLNAGLIPSAVAPGSLVGASYSLLDTDVVRGTTYFYWLEDVDIHGAATLHGPESASLPLIRLSNQIRRIGP